MVLHEEKPPEIPNKEPVEEQPELIPTDAVVDQVPLAVAADLQLPNRDLAEKQDDTAEVFYAQHLDHTLIVTPFISDANLSNAQVHNALMATTVKSRSDPGWVIVDTACTLSLIGEETMKEWETHLNEVYTMKSLRTDEVNVRFRGLAGESRSTEARCWPMMIGSKLGGLTTAVVPGSVPCLLSIEAMKGMHMVINTAEGIVQVTLSGKTVNLPAKHTPEGHIAVNLWAGLKKSETVFVLRLFARSRLLHEKPRKRMVACIAQTLTG